MIVYEASNQLAQMYKSEQKVKELLDLVELLQSRNEETKTRDEVITTCVNQILKFKLFNKADEYLTFVGLPTDAQTCLNYIKEMLNKSDALKPQDIEDALEKYDELRNGRADEQTH